MLQDLRDVYWRLRRSLGRGRGIVQDDTGPVQLVQIQPTNLETYDQVPRIAEYGFQSVPPDGCDFVAAFFSGDRSSGVVIGSNHQQYRVRGLAKGEVCISDNQGQQVYLRKNGILIKDKAGSMLAMNGDGTATVTANVKIVGTLEVTQLITADNDVTIAGVGSVKNHTHPGVQAGGSSTGAMQG